MPQKKKGDSSPSQNALDLLEILLENPGFMSLSEITAAMGTSKQSVCRYLALLDFSYYGKLLEKKYGKEHHYMLEVNRHASTVLKRANKDSNKKDSASASAGKKARPVKKSGKLQKTKSRDKKRKPKAYAK